MEGQLWRLEAEAAAQPPKFAPVGDSKRETAVDDCSATKVAGTPGTLCGTIGPWMIIGVYHRNQSKIWHPLSLLNHRQVTSLSSCLWTSFSGFGHAQRVIPKRSAASCRQAGENQVMTVHSEARTNATSAFTLSLRDTSRVHRFVYSASSAWVGPGCNHTRHRLVCSWSPASKDICFSLDSISFSRASTAVSCKRTMQTTF